MIKSLNWRIVAISAGVAFVLSCLVALINGVMLLTLLLRASVAAVVFGLIGGTTSVLIARFLPELNRLGQEQEEDAVGQQIDITSEPLPEDVSPFTAGQASDDRGAGNTAADRAGVVEEGPALSDDPAGEPLHPDSLSSQPLEGATAAVSEHDSFGSPDAGSTQYNRAGQMEDTSKLVNAVRTVMREDEMRSSRYEHRR